jgi:hypothetical protein
MPDDFDYSQERQLELMENRIREHQYQLGHAVNAFELGRCRNCNERLDDGRAFCDASCRQDFEDRLAADRRNGKYRGG